MKRIVLSLLLVIITIAWIIATTLHYQGLNSIQQLANYHDGIVSKKGLQHDTVENFHSTAGAAQVIIDSLDIPHIFGDNKNAMAYALGFMHARDRYFQMELLVYSVMGRLSEIIGEPGIASDKKWRKFELEEKAKKIWNNLRAENPALYEYLQSYEEGVNAYRRQESVTHRDPLYTIWNCSPKEWQPYFSFLIQWYMSGNLTLYDDYVNRQELLDKLPDTVRKILYPESATDGNYIIPQGTRKNELPVPAKSLVKLFRSDQINRYQSEPVNHSLGSNNWVIGGSRTQSGELFLCNDLHLFLASPNIFYEAQLCSPGWHVSGFTIPGVPVIVTGHNEKIAWGITNGEWDVTEQYLLKIDPENKDRYWLDGRWQNFTVKSFDIHIKDRSPQTIDIKYSAFGPVVQRDSITYGLLWHPQRSATAMEAFWKLMQAQDWSQFRQALSGYDYPAQNFAYADVAGNIGMICAGKMPVKPAGYSGGLLDGTRSPLNQYVPFDSLPCSYNPVQGYLFSANQQPERGHYYFASRWFSDTYRPRRIKELLAGNTKVSQEDMREMQLDVRDLSVIDIKAVATKYQSPKDLSENWKSFLAWDGNLNPSRSEAAFYKSVRAACRSTGKDISKWIQLRAVPSFDQMMHFLLNYDSLSCKGNVIYSRDLIARLIKKTDSLYTDQLHALSDKDYSAYEFTIPQMTFLPGMEISVKDVGGSDNTVNVNYGAHPVIRTLISIKDGVIHSSMINAVAQTGRINDPKYDQQLKMWKENKLHPTPFTTDPKNVPNIVRRILFTNK